MTNGKRSFQVSKNTIGRCLMIVMKAPQLLQNRIGLLEAGDWLISADEETARCRINMDFVYVLLPSKQDLSYAGLNHGRFSGWERAAYRSNPSSVP
jgi:hypothetical protein